MTNLLTRDQVADILQVKKSYLDVLAARKKGPPFIKLARRAVRYDADELAAWIQARKVICG